MLKHQHIKKSTFLDSGIPEIPCIITTPIVIDHQAYMVYFHRFGADFGPNILYFTMYNENLIVKL